MTVLKHKTDDEKIEATKNFFLWCYIGMILLVVVLDICQNSL